MIVDFLVFFKRVVNFLFKLFNRLKFIIYGIHYGKGLCIHGSIGIRKGLKSSITIGDNFYFSSGANMNPLTRNLRGFICCDDNAEITIGSNVAMSSVVIWAHKSIKIGNHVLCGGNVIIMDSDAHSLNYIYRRNLISDLQHKKDSPIVIEDDVFIGMNSMIMKGVTIGARSVIGAGSVVTKSIPSDCIVCGNPARIIKKMESVQI